MLPVSHAIEARLPLIDALPDGIEFSEELITLKTGRVVPCPLEKVLLYEKKIGVVGSFFGFGNRAFFVIDWLLKHEYRTSGIRQRAYHKI